MVRMETGAGAPAMLTVYGVKLEHSTDTFGRALLPHGGGWGDEMSDAEARQKETTVTLTAKDALTLAAPAVVEAAADSSNVRIPNLDAMAVRIASEFSNRQS